MASACGFRLGMIAGLLLAAAPAPAWEFLGSAGPVQIVYVDPARMNDTKLMVEIVEEVYRKAGREHAIQIDFFDDRGTAPRRPPYTAAQQQHRKAKFNFNPKNGMQRFVRLEIVPDPDKPGVMKFKETGQELLLPKPPS